MSLLTVDTNNRNKFSVMQTKLGSLLLLLCAQGRAEQAQYFFTWRRISQSEIRRRRNPRSSPAFAGRYGARSEGGQKFIPPQPTSFLPARVSGFVPAPPEAEQSINSVQKMFEKKSESLILVPGGGIEPPHPRRYWILSPARLPIPPSRLWKCRIIH